MPPVRVQSFDSVGEAEAAQSALRSAGVDCALHDDNIVGIDWLYCNAVGGIKLVVASEQLHDAAVALGWIEAPAAELESVEIPPDAAEPIRETRLVCPECGSDQVRRIPRLMAFWFLSVIFLGVGIVTHQPALAFAGVAAAALITIATPPLRCTACGERWTAERIDDERIADVEAFEERCPRCHEDAYHRVGHRRFQAASMLIPGVAVIFALIWLFLPKRECDACGFSR